jgi:large subunit ribosomal protein L23
MNTIIIKPIITEKAAGLSEKLTRYTFKVAKTANKIEIGKAVAATYNVSVVNVNTLRVPSKAKSRMTKTGILKGRKDAYKKAYVTLAKGETINFYENV